VRLPLSESIRFANQAGFQVPDSEAILILPFAFSAHRGGFNPLTGRLSTRYCL